MATRRNILRFAIVTVIVIVAAVSVVLVAGSRMRSTLIDTVCGRISEETGMSVRVESVSGNLWSRLRVEGVHLSTGEGLSISASAIDAVYSLPSLFASPPHLKEIRIVAPVIRIPADGDTPGAHTDSSDGKPARQVPLLADRILMTDGSVEYGDYRAGTVRIAAAILTIDGKPLVRLDTLAANFFPGTEGFLPVHLAGTIHSEDEEACSCTVRGTIGQSVLEHAGRLQFKGPLTGRGLFRFAPLSLEEILPLFGRERIIERGEASGVIRYAGNTDSVSVEVELDGVLNKLEYSSVRASALLKRTDVTIDRLRGVVNGAVFSGEGRLDLTGLNENRMRLTYSHLDLSRFMEELTGGRESDMNGLIRWEGTGRELTNLEGSFSVEMFPSRIGLVNIREARLSGVARNNGFRIDESYIRTLTSELKFQGRVGLNGTFSGELEAVLPSLNEFREAGRFDSLAGSASLSLHVSGRPECFRAEGEATVERGVVDRLSFESVRMNGWFERDHDTVHGGSGTRIESMTILSEPVDSLRVDLTLEGERLRMENLSAWRNDWDFRSEGEMIWSGDRMDLTLQDVRLRHADTVVVRPDRIFFRKEGEGFVLEPINFKFGGGTIDMKASSNDGDSIVAALHIRDADLSRLSKRLGVPSGILSDVNLSAVLEGRSGTRRGVVSLRSVPAERDSFPFSRVEGSLFIENGTVHLDSLLIVGNSESERVHLSGTFPVDPEEESESPIQVTVRSHNYPLSDLRFLSSRIDPYEGRLNAEIVLEGSWNDPRLWASCTVEDATVRGYRLGRVAGDSIRVVDGSLGFRIRLDSTWGRENRISGFLPARLSLTERSFELLDRGEMRVRARVPKGDFGFLALHVDKIEEGFGDFNLDAVVSGDLSDPKMDGVFELRDGLVILNGTSLFFERIDARFLLDEDKITVTRFGARSGREGRLDAWGTIGLEDFLPSTYDIHFSGKQYDLLVAEGVQITFTGEMALQPDTTLFNTVVPHLSGDVEAHGALIEKEFTSSDNLGGSSVLDPTGSPSWTCDILIRAPNNFWVRNNTAHLEMGGDVQVRRSAQGLGALGTFDVIRGSYWVYNNEFRIISGEVLFTDPDNLREATLEVSARTDVLGEQIDVRVYGEVKDVRLETTSESGFSEGEILSLLTLRTHPEDDVSSGEILSSWFTTLASRLSREMSRGMGGIGTIEIGTSEDLPEIRYGNYLSSDLYFGFSQTIQDYNEWVTKRSPTKERLPIPEKQVRVEYRLRRALLIQGEVGTLTDGNRFLNMDLRVRIPY